MQTKCIYKKIIPNSRYITYGTPATTFFVCEEKITDAVVVGDYTFFTRTTRQYGTEIWMINNCTDALTLGGQLSEDYLFPARKTIHATQQISNANVIYRAGNSIQLLPGFKANTNTTFKAEIDTCPN